MNNTPISHWTSDSRTSDSKLFMAVVFIIGIAVGFLLGSYWQSSKKTPANAPDNSKTTTEQSSGQAVSGNQAGGENATTDTGTPIENAINVSDQAAGTLVYLDSVNLKEAAWVAVREDNQGGLGRILGAQRLDAGAYAKVVVSLLRPTEAGKVYHIVLYKDDGTKVFNYSAAGFIPGLTEQFTAFAAK